MRPIRVSVLMRGGPLQGSMGKSETQSLDFFPERSDWIPEGYYAKGRQISTECFDEIVAIVEYEWIPA